MADNNKFYWIKLRTDFFAEDSKIDDLMNIGAPNGAEYVCLYLKLCLMTANKGGRLCSERGEVIIPYDAEKIARDAKYFSVDTVVVAMELYRRLGLIYEEADGILAIADEATMIGTESANREAVKKRAYRERLRTKEGTAEGTNCPTEIRDKEIRDKDIKSIGTKSATPKFTPPTIDELRSFISEKGYHVDADRFFYYYEANGWKVGRNSMKNWRAAVAQWETKDKQERPQIPAKKSQFSTFQQTGTDYAAVMERKMAERLNK